MKDKAVATDYTEISVAMGNGREDAKAAVNYVTTTVEDNGVYNALKHFEVI